MPEKAAPAEKPEPAAAKASKADKDKEPPSNSLVTETVNSSTLSAAAKFELEEHGREFPEELFNVALVPTTSVTATKK